ncbi:MAG: 3-phosphoshikimate 1-carboxyvinyltransferase [Bacteroidales bacterium]|nr:3-phosphoshikimate 1-carboxyvinyltransferase [Bacteroidales bacterium]
MGIISIQKGLAKGVLNAPPSKSYAHRYLTASFLASLHSNKPIKVSNIELSEDISATLDSIKALGGIFKIGNGDIIFEPCTLRQQSNVPDILNCRESGSTLRFFIPIALALYGEGTFAGSEKLISRGIGPYETIFSEKGIKHSKSASKIEIYGALQSGDYIVDGSISSQFITGLLFALPLLDGNSHIQILPPVTSLPYIQITLDVLKHFGIDAKFCDNNIDIPGNQHYTAIDSICEGDWSNAAFLHLFNHIGGDVVISGLNPDSKQADKCCLSHFKALEKGFCTIDLENCIDLGPILFTFAALKNGAKFENCRRLRIKESDRVADLCMELAKIGAEAKIDDNSLIIKPADLRNISTQITFNSHNDHRIAMSLAVASTLFSAEIEGYEAVAKSYPSFFQDLAKIGIIYRKND